MQLSPCLDVGGGAIAKALRLPYCKDQRTSRLSRHCRIPYVFLRGMEKAEMHAREAHGIIFGWKVFQSTKNRGSQYFAIV